MFVQKNIRCQITSVKLKSEKSINCKLKITGKTFSFHTAGVVEQKTSYLMSKFAVMFSDFKVYRNSLTPDVFFPIQKLYCKPCLPYFEIGGFHCKKACLILILVDPPLEVIITKDRVKTYCQKLKQP